MPELVITKRVSLGPHRLRPGQTKHTKRDASGLREFPPFVALGVASYPKEQSCYLFHICENGEGTDTWHQTLEEALDQAEWEFGVQRNEWVDVHIPLGSPENSGDTQSG
jgi:hypothetical protein